MELKSETQRKHANTEIELNFANPNESSRHGELLEIR
jgi:hypothetical protein